MKQSILIFLLVVVNLFANNNNQQERVRVGFEIDALPYITGGYYISGWAGIHNFRLRGVIANVNTPDFIIPKGFENLETKAYTLLIDYFPYSKKNEYEKFWIATGIEYWSNNVENSRNHVSRDYDSWIYTLGCGYTYKILNNFYINPWGAFHFPFTNTKGINVGNDKYKQKKFVYEISLKIGYYF